MLALWNTSRKDYSKVAFEFPPGVVPTLKSNPRNYESNHKLPFYEDPSKGIVGLAISGSPSCDLLVVPVKALIMLSNMPGTSGAVSWRRWREHVTELRSHQTFYILHAQIVFVSNLLTTPTLCIHDFSRRFEGEAQGDEIQSRGGNGPLIPMSYEPTSPRIITLNIGDGVASLDYDFQFTEGGVLAIPVSLSKG